MQYKITTLSAVVAASLAATVAQGHEPLPNFHIMADTAALHAKPLNTKAALQKRVQSLKQRNNDVQLDSRTGKPTFVWANGNTASAQKAGLSAYKPGPARNKAAAQFHLKQNATRLQIDNDTIASASIFDMHDTGTGPLIARYRQTYRGHEVIGQQLNVMMRRDNSLVAISGQLSSHVGKAKKADAKMGKSVISDFSLTADTAAKQAFSSLKLKQFPKLTQTKVSGEYTWWKADTNGGELGVRGDVRTKQVYFSLPDELVPAYYVEYSANDGEGIEQMYGAIVDARSGKLLVRNNLMSDAEFTYRVFADADGQPWDGPQKHAGNPFPAMDPENFKPTLFNGDLVTLAHGPISTEDPWLAPNARETNGNNVDAYLDLSAPDGFYPATYDFRGSVSSTAGGIFNWAFNPNASAQGSAVQQMAAVTHLFYMNNWLHDDFYDVGFNEAAGNAQQNNYGRGGEQYDPILAQGQDYSGVNNANMSTPADGRSPRMQMYLWPNAGDGTYSINYTATDGSAAITSFQPSGFGPASFNYANVDMVRYNDATGTADDACEAMAAGSLTGKIALVQRGTCTFVVKVKNAQNAGATGVLIYNNAATGLPGMGGTDPTITIGSFGISQADGTTLIAKLGLGAVSTSLFASNPGAKRDSTVDSLIIAHEWGHYISNRLVGNSMGLINNQGRSMGEGWGDFHALMTTVQASDLAIVANANFGGIYTAGAYSVYNVNFPAPDATFYYGIRRAPYTTDLTRNPLTFKYIADGEVLLPFTNGAINSEVHNSGEIWANALFDAYVSLLRDTERHSFAEARQLMKTYLVAGYKMTPIAPTYTEARDAILAAALATDQADFALMAAAFARHGLGSKAQSPDRFSTDHVGAVEDFSTSAATTHKGDSYNVSYSHFYCDADGVLDAGETAELTVTVQNSGFSEMDGAVLHLSSDADVTFGSNDIVINDLAPLASRQIRVPVRLNAGEAGAPLNITASYTLGEDTVEADVAPIYTNFDLQKTHTTDNVALEFTDWTSHVISGEPAEGWLRLANADIGLDDVADDDVWHFGVNEGSPADYAIESPEIIVGEDDALVITWKQLFYFEFDANYNYDGGVVEYSIDNGDWTDAGTKLTPAYNVTLVNTATTQQPLKGRAAYGAISAGFPAVIDGSLDLSGMDLAGKTVKVRFRIGTDDNSAEMGWLIDQINVSGATNQPFSEIVEDAADCAIHAPTVSAGADATVTAGEETHLTATANDVDAGDTLTYHWEQLSGSSAQLEDADHAVATITPSVPGAYTFRVTVTDSTGFTASDEVTITANKPKDGSNGSGSFGFLTLLLLPFAMLRRRRQ